MFLVSDQDAYFWALFFCTYNRDGKPSFLGLYSGFDCFGCYLNSAYRGGHFHVPCAHGAYYRPRKFRGWLCSQCAINVSIEAVQASFSFEPTNGEVASRKSFPSALPPFVTSVILTRLTFVCFLRRHFSMSSFYLWDASACWDCTNAAPLSTTGSSIPEISQRARSTTFGVC